jgi:DNA (cytosine-5)-methyltransferase 1
MTASSVFAAYDSTKVKGRKTPPSPLTPAEAMSVDLRHMSQDEVNRRIAEIEAQWRAEDRLRELFSGRVTKLYAAARRFRYVDLFCGAGGSSTGLTMAGGQLVMALNHSLRNIITHSTNFPGAEHDCVDINHYDMRNLPRGFEVLWASPICTEISPAGGNGTGDQPGEEVPEELLKYGPVGKDTFQRTRATAYDVIRACEVHMPPIVIVENVVEFCTRWKLFAWWLMGMMTLGYDYQIISANSAHIEGPDGETAPQSRDRMYIMFHRRDVAKPDVQVRPRSWCGNCSTEVRGVQTWKDPEGYETESGKRFLIGKYGPRSGQYYFTCPGCFNMVQPIIKPAASIINFHFIGGKIGERKRPLVDNSRRRIGRGILEFGGMAIVNSNHDTDRAYSLGETMTTRTVKIGEGLATADGMQPFIDGCSDQAPPASIHATLRTITTKPWQRLVSPPGGPRPFLDANGGSWNDAPASVDDTFRTRTANPKGWEALCVPPGAFVDTARNHAVPSSLFDPITTVSAGGNHQALVVPYNRTGVAYPAATREFQTFTTKDRQALVSGWDGATMDELIDNSHYRMIQWYEQLLAQAFPLDYLMTGNIGERTAGAGNAVSCNVAGWFGMAAADALERTAASPARARRRSRAGAR